MEGGNEFENINEENNNEKIEKKEKPLEKPKNKNKNKKYEFKNEGILLIFNKIITEYFFNIKNRKKDLNEENEENNSLALLKKELESTTFNDIKDLKEKNNIISIIKDYYLYFVTRNEVLERETNDLGNLCNLLEMFCEFQFEFNSRENKELTVDDLLAVIKWTNDFYFEINELLYCVEYFKLEKIFQKKNIFNEISNKRLNKVDIDNDDKKNIIGLKKAMETIICVLNDRCIEDPESIARIIEVIPTLYQIEQKNNLNSKEIYFLCLSFNCKRRR